MDWFDCVRDNDEDEFMEEFNEYTLRDDEVERDIIDSAIRY